MNCERKDEKLDLNNLTLKQRFVLQPALTFMQIGATFYLSEMIKPIILPVFILSVAIVLLVVLKARKQSDQFSAQKLPANVLVLVQTKNNSFEQCHADSIARDTTMKTIAFTRD